MTLEQIGDPHQIVRRLMEGALLLQRPFEGLREDDLARRIDDGDRGIVKRRGEAEVVAHGVADATSDGPRSLRHEARAPILSNGPCDLRLERRIELHARSHE